jgi:tetratricopeptide (TPR) repeat protein
VRRNHGILAGWRGGTMVLALAAAALAGPAEDRRAANEAFDAGRWDEAARLFERVTAATPDDGPAWIRLALARLERGEFEAARTALAKAEGVEGRTACVEFAAATAPPEEDLSIPFRFGPCVVRKDGRERKEESAAPEEGLVLLRPR